jgi:hypothetical protein
MTNAPSDHAEGAIRYTAMAARFRQRAEGAHDPDFAETYGRLAVGYDTLAVSAQALSHFPMTGVTLQR